MPNMQNVNKKIGAIQLPLELWSRLRKEAERLEMSINQLITFILHEKLDSVSLDETDYEWIRAEVKKNEQKRR